MFESKLSCEEIKQKINKCWEWCGYIHSQNKYSYYAYKSGKSLRVHKLLIQSFNGQEVPFNKVTDHLCKNTKCINPFHLEIVTPKENLMRSSNIVAMNAKKTHCKRGHEFIDKNTILHIVRGGLQRTCRICHNLAQKRRRIKKRGNKNG